VLCNSDDLCGGALYAQAVEGERPDVTVLPRQHLANAWTWRRVQSSRLGEPIEDHSTGDARTIATARTHTLLTRVGDRVRWEGSGEGEDTTVRARWRFVSGETPVLAAVSVRPMAATEVDRSADAWVRERLSPGMGSGARWVGAMVLFAAASRVARDDMTRASVMWRSTLSINPEHVSAYTNLGVAAARRGDFGAAITLTRAALAIDPERPVAWRNLRDFLRATGNDTGAREAERESHRRR
jgi:tetratricopeptide (TPR) repeat protein